MSRSGFLKHQGGWLNECAGFAPMITFGGDGGMNAHADHMLVSALTTAAFHWCGQTRRYPELGAVHRPKRLFYVTTDVLLLGRPSPNPMPWSVELDVRSVKERKTEAFRQHASQAPLMEQNRAFFEEHGDTEFYAFAAANEPQPVTRMTDLFEGLG